MRIRFRRTGVLDDLAERPDRMTDLALQCREPALPERSEPFRPRLPEAQLPLRLRDLQNVFHLMPEDVPVDRLAEERGRPEREGPFDGDDVVTACHDDDRQMPRLRACARPLDHAKPVHDRHVEIADGDVEFLLLKGVDGGKAVLGLHHVDPPFQRRPHQEPLRRVVIDDKHRKRLDGLGLAGRGRKFAPDHATQLRSAGLNLSLAQLCEA